jgi:pimeloyl-ACP methyl ester carboxylesterase
LALTTPTLLPIYDFGGHGPVIHLSVANGFPPQTYKPLLDPLTRGHRIISALPRALWSSPPPPESLRSWRQIADDILTSIREREISDLVAIGHSMGAVASTQAAIVEPGRFKALILLEPTFLPFQFVAYAGLMRALGQMRRFPLVKGALRRRSQFASVEEAYSYWRGKALFGDWRDDVLRLYAESITRPSPAGGVELAWSRRWEAQYYRKVILLWQRQVAKLRGLLPVLAIQGSLTDTFQDVPVRAFHRLVPDATIARIEGHGHLFPHSAPDVTREIIEDWLDNQGL